ncbi:MAG TPA: hypothetical protein VL241_05115, partial [Gemmatimonadales bacterium]|nr:hypothetical protein [Gemmatimonadales bacterium]
ARTALQVEASSAYVAAARGEAERRGQADRVSIRHGDFVELAQQLPSADLVTLDRVICCYPDFERLIERSAEKALRFWAASFPRERWFVRLSMAWENAGRARAGNPFRTYVHPVAQVYALLEAAGLAPLRIQRGLFWEYLLCERKSLPAGSGPRSSGG